VGARGPVECEVPHIRARFDAAEARVQELVVDRLEGAIIENL
jgi:hypothetical protein